MKNTPVRWTSFTRIKPGEVAMIDNQRIIVETARKKGNLWHYWGFVSDSDSTGCKENKIK